MKEIRIETSIAAAAEEVFAIVADIREFSRVIPEIVDVEFLSEQRTGVGTRFRETRQMGRRRATTELEVTEYVPGRQVRLVADAGGATWDSSFCAEAEDGATRLVLTVTVTPHSLAAKMALPMMMGSVTGALEKDLAAVRAACEAAATDS